MSTKNEKGAADKSAFAESYNKVIGEIRAVPDAELAEHNVSINGSVTTILGALPEIVALRPEIAKLPQIDQKLVDGLGDYARAAGEANSRYAIAMGPESDLQDLYEAAMREREVLRSDASALATRGIIDPARLSAFKGLTGFKNVAFELIDWANLMHEVWPTIEGKTALTQAEIEHAKDVGEKLVVAAGLREQGPAMVQDVARVRDQAFTLMMRAYDEVRRAVTFLRWKQGDADTIAPSLYAGRGGRGKATKADATTDTAPTAPAAPTNGANNAPVATAPGMPGGSPLAS